MFAIALSQVASSWELLSSNSALHSYRFRVASLICPFGQKSWGKHCNDNSYWQSERHTVCRCAFETTINRNTNWKRDREIQTAIPIWLLYFHSFFIFRIRFYWLVRISYCCWCCRWRRWRHYHRFLCFHRLCNNNECAVWMVLTGQNNKIEIIGTSDDGEEENGAEIEKYSDWTCQHWRKATRRRRWYRCQSNNIEAVVSMQSHIYIYRKMHMWLIQIQDYIKHPIYFGIRIQPHTWSNMFAWHYIGYKQNKIRHQREYQ